MDLTFAVEVAGAVCRDTGVKKMKYYLDDKCTLCGWKNLPFAVYDAKSHHVDFTGKEEFLFLFNCNGKKEIDLSAQSERVRRYVDTLMEKKLLREALDGETRTLFYNEYPGIFKKVYSGRSRANVITAASIVFSLRPKACWESRPRSSSLTLSVSSA